MRAGCVLQVDPASGMIDQVHAKIAAAGPGCEMRAVCADLLDDAGPLERESFDLVVSKLAFHHISAVSSMVAAVWPLLKSGGRLCICDLEATSNVRLFHLKEQTLGVEYEHDGFSEEAAREWFEGGDEAWAGVEVARVGFSQPTSAGWVAAGHNSIQAFTMMLVSAVKVGCHPVFD